MKNKEIRRKTLRLWNDNLSLIAFMALMLAVFQTVVSIASVITFEAVGVNTVVSILSMFVTAPITICMYNVYSLLVRGGIRVKKSYLFEWLGDFRLIWHSVKTQLMFSVRMLPWVFVFSLFVSFAATVTGILIDTAGLSQTAAVVILAVIFVIALLFLVYQAFRYQGGLFECAAYPMKIITPIFHIGVIKMKYNLKEYCRLMLSYLPVILIFSAPVIAYEVIVGQYDAVYYALLVLETLGTSFIVNPLIGISGMMRYSVGAKLPPEHFFRSFGMRMPREYTGENVSADGTAEKPEITEPERVPLDENPGRQDIPFDNAPESKPEEENSEEE